MVINISLNRDEERNRAIKCCQGILNNTELGKYGLDNLKNTDINKYIENVAWCALDVYLSEVNPNVVLMEFCEDVEIKSKDFEEIVRDMLHIENKSYNTINDILLI